MKHPDQPMYLDDGVVRFRPNRLIQLLQEMGIIDLNFCSILAQTRTDISADDQIQLAQLIGYSVGGFCDLPYVEDRADEYWSKATELLDSVED